MSNVNYYNYKELRAAALAGDAQAINDLGKWFEDYGTDYWNGEYFDCDEGYRLFPIYEERGEDEYETVGYEFR